MTISKAHWSSDGNELRLSMPIAKVDRERRIVSGFATLDNVDRQGDIVPSDASIKAFEKFRGNLREMHQNVAVGKVVSFKEDQYFDQDNKKFYSGVYVSAYVSKGAQDTWEKVLDGTLTGFSIGGNIKDYEDVYNGEMDKSVRVIKDYELYELSLVDNPANQYANVISIEKNHDSGYLAKTDMENVFWDEENDIVFLSKEDSALSPQSGKPMQNIGFVETNDADKADAVKTILLRIKNNESEVVEMATRKAKISTEEVEVEKTVDAPVAEAETIVEKAEEETTAKKIEHDDDEMEDDDDKEEVTKSVSSEEVVEVVEAAVVETAEIEKSAEIAETAQVEVAEVNEVADLAKTISDTMTATLQTLADTVKGLNEKIEDLHKSVSGVTTDVSEVRQNVEQVKGSFNEFGKRVDAVEADTAFRKSGDLGEIVQEPVMVQKSLWGGRFLKKSDLFN
jgi:hypothetical protein